MRDWCTNSSEWARRNLLFSCARKFIWLKQSFNSCFCAWSIISKGPCFLCVSFCRHGYLCQGVQLRSRRWWGWSCPPGSLWRCSHHACCSLPSSREAQRSKRRLEWLPSWECDRFLWTLWGRVRRLPRSATAWAPHQWAHQSHRPQSNACRW